MWRFIAGNVINSFDKNDKLLRRLPMISSKLSGLISRLYKKIKIKRYQTAEREIAFVCRCLLMNSRLYLNISDFHCLLLFAFTYLPVVQNAILILTMNERDGQKRENEDKLTISNY